MIIECGFKPTLSLLLGESVGGTWQVCNCGFGCEVTAPYRACFVDEFPSQIAEREERGAPFAEGIFFTIGESAAELKLKKPCELQTAQFSSAAVEPAREVEPAIPPARSGFATALEAFVRRNQ